MSFTKGFVKKTNLKKEVPPSTPKRDPDPRMLTNPLGSETPAGSEGGGVTGWYGSN